MSRGNNSQTSENKKIPELTQFSNKKDPTIESNNSYNFCCSFISTHRISKQNRREIMDNIIRIRKNNKTQNLIGYLIPFRFSKF